MITSKMVTIKTARKTVVGVLEITHLKNFLTSYFELVDDSQFLMTNSILIFLFIIFSINSLPNENATFSLIFLAIEEFKLNDYLFFDFENE